MQNPGRFGEIKLNKVVFFCFFGMFLSVSTGGYGTKLTAAQKEIVHSQVCLEFVRNGAVGPLVHHDLFFRKKYTFGYITPLNLTG